MSEIEVVINITKHEWEYLNKLVKNGDQLGHYERLLVNGTPLPEEHGDLKDADALISSLGVSDEDIYCMHIIEENAPTIIKANRSR